MVEFTEPLTTPLWPMPTSTLQLSLTPMLRSPPSPMLMSRSQLNPTSTRRSLLNPTCMLRFLLSLTLMSRFLLNPTLMSRSQLNPTFTRSPLPWLLQLWLPTTTEPQFLPTTTELFPPSTTTSATILPSPLPTMPTLLTMLLQLWLTNCAAKRRKTRAVFYCDKENHFRRDHIGL